MEKPSETIRRNEARRGRGRGGEKEGTFRGSEREREREKLRGGQRQRLERAEEREGWKDRRKTEMVVGGVYSVSVEGWTKRGFKLPRFISINTTVLCVLRPSSTVYPV